MYSMKVFHAAERLVRKMERYGYDLRAHRTKIDGQMTSGLYIGEPQYRNSETPDPRPELNAAGSEMRDAVIDYLLVSVHCFNARKWIAAMRKEGERFELYPSPGGKWNWVAYTDHNVSLRALRRINDLLAESRRGDNHIKVRKELVAQAKRYGWLPDLKNFDPAKWYNTMRRNGYRPEIYPSTNGRHLSLHIAIDDDATRRRRSMLALEQSESRLHRRAIMRYLTEKARKDGTLKALRAEMRARRHHYDTSPEYAAQREREAIARLPFDPAQWVADMDAAGFKVCVAIDHNGEKALGWSLPDSLDHETYQRLMARVDYRANRKREVVRYLEQENRPDRVPQSPMARAA